MRTDSLRVVVIAREHLLAEALTEALAGEPGLDVVERSTTVGDSPRAKDVDVLVAHLDAALRGPSLDLVRSALRHHPELGVVLVSEPVQTGLPDLTREALRLGVRGWVGSDEPLTHLVSAVKDVAARRVCLPVTVLTSAFAADPTSPVADAARLRLLRLTPRQHDVLRCLLDGRSRAQTGVTLEMSDNTVRTHVGAILRRLEVHSIVAAVAVAREAEPHRPYADHGSTG